MNITEEKRELIYNEENVAKRWKEYLEELYKRHSCQIMTLEREDELGKEDMGEPIMEEEFEKAMQGLKNRKAAGIDDMPSAPIKKSG